MTKANPFEMQYGGFRMIWAFCKKCWRWHRKSSKIAQRHKEFWMTEEELSKARQQFVEMKRVKA